jgi:hypothetical protein
MEPDARALYVIRNCLEHRYLKVYEMLIERRRPTAYPMCGRTDQLIRFPEESSRTKLLGCLSWPVPR